MSRAYLCGPMSGMPGGNFDAFKGAAEALRRDGWDIVSPVEMNEADGLSSAVDPGHPRREEFLARDLSQICDPSIEAVVALPGWELSAGCLLEVGVANGLRKPILSYPHLISIPPCQASVLTQSETPKRHPASQRFHDVLHEMGTLHDEKQADYGREDDPFANVRASSEWTMDAWVGAMVRATDKVRRLQTFARTGHLQNEGVRDSFLDLAVYVVIALCLYEELAAD